MTRFERAVIEAVRELHHGVHYMKGTTAPRVALAISHMEDAVAVDDAIRGDQAPPDARRFSIEPTRRGAILAEVAAERARQEGKGYDAKRDRLYTPRGWHSLLTDYAGWARRMWEMGSPDKARRRLIQVAAIAVAAVEAMDD
jgi:hypothetical protein